MMKKNILSAMLVVTTCGTAFSQVGINNNSPQQTLHILGTTSGVSQNVMRVDGLSISQNSAHENAGSQKRVFANTNGDLVIMANNQSNIFYLSPQLPTTPVPAAGEASVSTYIFTLAYRSLVHFEARTGLTITTDINATPALRNGQARAFGSYFKFTQAPAGVSQNTRFGEKIIPYSTLTGGEQLNGIFYLEPRKDLVLPAGTYTVALYGFSGDSNLALSVNQPGQNNQQMRVSITPISY